MKKIFLLFLLLITLPMAAQDEVVREVCGVQFGDTFDDAKVKIRQFFEGRPSNSPLAAALPSTHIIMEMPGLYEIECKYEKFEGIKFDNIYFNFDENYRLENVSFWIYCDKKKEAKAKLNEVADKLRAKYTLYEGKDDNGNFVGYGGGINYKDHDKCAFFLRIFEDTDIILSFRTSGY